MISYDSVPSNLRIPFFAIEINNSQAVQGAQALEYRGLLMGQRKTAGTVAAHVLTPLTNADQAKTYFGVGSILAQMAEAWFANNKTTRVDAIALDDAGAGVQATSTMVVSGPATAAGTIYLYIGGRRILTSVANSDAASAIATAIAAAVNADTNLPVTAAVETAVNVVLTANHKGVLGNKIDLRLNYNDGEALPAGVGVTTPVFASGVTNPTLTTAIAALGDIWYHVIAFPWTDATSLTAIEAELSRRFGPMVQADGVAISSDIDTVANLQTLGNGRNSQHLSIAGMKLKPSTPWEFAARVAANVALYGAIDPARPFQTLELVGALPPADSARLTNTENNTLLYSGISPCAADSGDKVRILRMITTYKTNSQGQSDTSYLSLTTMLTLMYLRWDFRTFIQNRYPRHKLASDGTRVGAGQAVITPAIGKAEALSRFRIWEEMGLVEGFDQFKRDLIVERNSTNPDRLDFLLPPDLINQFIVGAGQIQFRV